MSDVTLNRYLAYGTTAQRLAFTPNPPTPASGPSFGAFWYDTDIEAIFAYDFGLGSWVGGSGTVTHTSGALAANQVIIGNGTGDLKALGSLGTTTTVLHGNAAGAPTYGQVSLTADVTGDLPFSNVAQIAGLSVLGVTGSSTADVAAITAGTDGHVLQRISSSSLAFAAPAGGVLEQHTASSSASLDFTSCISSTYDEYRIEFVNIIPATATDVLWMRVHLSGSYDSGANYSWANCTWRAADVTREGATGATKITLGFSTGLGTNANWGLCGTANLFSPQSTAVFKRLTGKISYLDNTPLRISCELQGAYEVASAIDGFQFLFSSGNIASGTIRVYGIPK